MKVGGTEEKQRVSYLKILYKWMAEKEKTNLTKTYKG